MPKRLLCKEDTERACHVAALSFMHTHTLPYSPTRLWWARWQPGDVEARLPVIMASGQRIVDVAAQAKIQRPGRVRYLGRELAASASVSDSDQDAQVGDGDEDEVESAEEEEEESDGEESAGEERPYEQGTEEDLDNEEKQSSSQTRSVALSSLNEIELDEVGDDDPTCPPNDELPDGGGGKRPRGDLGNTMSISTPSASDGACKIIRSHVEAVDQIVAKQDRFWGLIETLSKYALEGIFVNCVRFGSRVSGLGNHDSDFGICVLGVKQKASFQALTNMLSECKTAAPEGTLNVEPQPQKNTVVLHTRWFIVDFNVSSTTNVALAAAQTEGLKARLRRLSEDQIRGVQLLIDLTKRHKLCWDKAQGAGRGGDGCHRQRAG